MENRNIKPMNLERQEKLKIFGIVSVLKEVPLDLIKDKLGLSVVVTYNPTEAVLGAGEALRANGKDPAGYFLNFMQLSVNVEDIVNIPPPPVTIVPVKKEEPKKTVEEIMIDNTRMIFNLVGTPIQKKSVEKIIKKFKSYTQKNLQTKSE